MSDNDHPVPRVIAEIAYPLPESSPLSRVSWGGSWPGSIDGRYRVVRAIDIDGRAYLNLLKLSVDGMGQDAWLPFMIEPKSPQPPQFAIVLHMLSEAAPVHDEERRQWWWREGLEPKAQETVAAYCARIEADNPARAQPVTHCDGSPCHGPTLPTPASLFLPPEAYWSARSQRWYPPQGWTEPDRYPGHHNRTPWAEP